MKKTTKITNVILGTLMVGFFALGFSSLSQNRDIEADAAVVETKRVWMKNSITSTWDADGAGTAIHYWGGAQGTTFPGVRVKWDAANSLVYFDLPADVTTYMFVRVYGTDGVVFYDVPLASITGKYFDLARLSTTDTSTADVWNKTAPEAFDSSMLHKIWRIWGNGAGIERPEGSTAESRNVSNRVINSLLYGYLTCSPSTNNGYGAFDTLDDHFNLTGRTYVETDTVLDFIDDADYATGRGTGVTVLTSVKVAMMQAMANSSGMSTLPLLDDKKNLNTILIVGLLGLTTIAGLYISSKKKIKV